jgi:hypothetical protein
LTRHEHRQALREPYAIIRTGVARVDGAYRRRGDVEAHLVGGRDAEVAHYEFDQDRLGLVLLDVSDDVRLHLLSPGCLLRLADLPRLSELPHGDRSGKRGDPYRGPRGKRRERGRGPRVGNGNDEQHRHRDGEGPNRCSFAPRHPEGSR